MKTWWIYSITAVFLFFIIRLPYFASVPTGLNRDEAALGYNAYSILLTGKDEYQTWFPISITSFGDQKLPAYVYTLIPFIALFGIHTWVIRLPSLLAGIVIMFCVGKIAHYLAPSFTKHKTYHTHIAGIAMLAVALSPWSNHFSRVAYEAHLGMMFFLLGFIAYMHARSTTFLRSSCIWTAMWWSLALLSYHSYHIVVPLFTLALLLVDWAKIHKTPHKTLGIAVSVGVGVLLLMGVGGVWSGNTKKSQGISPFHAESLWRSVTLYRSASSWISPFNKILFHPSTEAVYRFASNYATTLSGSFFFVRGSSHPDHNPSNSPNFHLFILPFVILGFARLWEKRDVAEARFILLFITVGLAAPSFTISPEHTVRMSPIFPFIDLVAAIGFMFCVESFSSHIAKRIFVGVMGVCAVWSIFHITTHYLFLAQTSEVSHEKYELLAQTIIKYKTDTNEVVTQSPTSSPYIWYVVASRMKPQEYWKTVEHYPEDDEHFRHVKRVGNVTFESIQWPHLYERAKNHELILIFEPRETPGDVRASGRLRMIDVVRDSHQTVLYEVWSVQ